MKSEAVSPKAPKIKAIFLKHKLYLQRIQGGYTFRAIGKKIGRTGGTVQKWESGECVPGANSLFRLARFLKKDVNYFLEF